MREERITTGRLWLQVDEFESEVEGLAATKRGKKPPPRLAHFEESINRHRQHVLRLEQMLRLLDNESLSVEEVTETRDMVDDYMDRNQVRRLRPIHCKSPARLLFKDSPVRLQFKDPTLHPA